MLYCSYSSLYCLSTVVTVVYFNLVIVKLNCFELFCALSYSIYVRVYHCSRSLEQKWHLMIIYVFSILTFQKMNFLSKSYSQILCSQLERTKSMKKEYFIQIVLLLYILLTRGSTICVSYIR